MKYLLDTNTCIYYLNGRSTAIRDHFHRQQPADIAVCSVVIAEMFAGAMKSNFPERSLAKQRAFLSHFASYPFDDEAALHYGQIRAGLELAGSLIGPYDLQIAAIAVSHNLILVTSNIREFSRVPTLQIEDWTRP
ncbi:MAG: type II toxin-antitoxin system VapC family toxin [Capsulimonas sp.]|uniref:type II toxin-antitoxin system tRNA(fMet)-specific endonuclease VapC n=1 Tax=Capsulimonas sp. TaxID=2494211 RepID=UPI003263C370